jgi:hypothetical protein
MVFDIIAKNKRFLLLLSLVFMSSNSWAQVNLQFSKPITMGGYICAAPWLGGCSGYSLSAGDTVPVGKIWKVEFIGAGGYSSLCPRFSINEVELNGWNPNQNKLWSNLQPIWLDSGDYFTFTTQNCGSLNSPNLMSWTVNVIEFNKGAQ